MQETATKLAAYCEDHELQSSEKAAEQLHEQLDQLGGSLLIFESTYWGKECFGPDHWVDMVFADIKADSGEAYLLDNAISAGDVLAAYRKKERAVQELLAQRNDVDSEYDSLDATYWASELQNAKNQLGALKEIKRQGGRLGEGWIPQSKVVAEWQGEEPEDFIIFTGEGQKQGSKDDAEVVIGSTTMVTSRYNRYEKLAIDIPYDENKSPQDYFDWDTHHFQAKYNGDDFECWASDTRPREIAGILAEHYDGVAVHESLMERYDE